MNASVGQNVILDIGVSTSKQKNTNNTYKTKTALKINSY